MSYYDDEDEELNQNQQQKQKRESEIKQRLKVAEQYAAQQAKVKVKEAGKETAKKGGKALAKGGKAAGKAIGKGAAAVGKGILTFMNATAPWSYIILGVILLIIIVAILIACLLGAKLEAGKREEGDPANVPYVVSNMISNAVIHEDVDDNGNGTGKYSIWFSFEEDGKTTVLNYRDSVDKIAKSLNEEGENLKEVLTKDMGKQKQYIRWYIESEIATTFPRVGDEGLQGKIEFRRVLDDGSVIERLAYTPKDKFDEMIKSNSNDVLNYFTTDDKGGTIVANSRTTKISSNGKDTTISTITPSSPMNLKDSLKKYTIPFDYLWALHVRTGDEPFMNKLVGLAKDSKVIVSILEEKKVTTTTETTTCDVTSYSSVMVKTSSTEPEMRKTNETTTTETETYTSTRTEITSKIKVTKASTWIIDYNDEVKERTTKTNSSTSSTDLPNPPNNDSSVSAAYGNWYEAKDGENVLGSTSSEHTIRTNYKKTTTVDTQEYIYEDTTPTKKYKDDKNDSEDNVVKFLLKSNKALETLKSIKRENDIFNEMLKGNENAEYMIDITKYLMYKATGDHDYGVTELDLDKISLTTMGGKLNSSNLLADWLAVWENGEVFWYLKGERTEADWESNYWINRIITKDKKYFICETDIGLDNGTRNYGFGILHYQNGTWNNVEQYAKEGIDITQYNELGVSQLPVEKVERVRASIINDGLESIKSQTAGLNLTQSQLDSLLCVSYKWGGIGNFCDVYHYYQEGNYDAFIENYTDAGGKPFKTGNGELEYETKRKEATWKMFHEGVYMTADGKELKGNVTGSNGKGQEILGDNTGGIRGTYISGSSGLTFTEYVQNDTSCPWYWDCGCYVTTQSTILSGFGINITPNYIPGWHGEATNDTFSSYGLKWNGYNYNPSAQDMANDMKAGGVIIFRVINNYVNTDDGSTFYEMHILSILDYENVNGVDKVYVLDPWGGTNATGWANLENIANATTWYSHVTK